MMELHREIRALYIKTSAEGSPATQETVDGLWRLAAEIPLVAIDMGDSGDIVLHCAFEFSLDSWNTSMRALRTAMSLLRTKTGYLAVRKVLGSEDALKTDLEWYKVTKRGIYNVDLSDPADIIEDLVRYSGNNKRHQQIGALEKLFRFIQRQEDGDKTAGD
ncbi:MAG: hypothetical protein HQL10_05210 [Nitrospirae bacterium]|nr:hypothetical protein [Nitrospirota bacterium]